jgi:hypothetical protein
MLKKLLKFGLEYALKRYGSRMRGGSYSSYNKYGYGDPLLGKRYYKKRKKKKLFDLFD